MTKFKNASDCKSIDEVRSQIDIIDYEIIKLFAERFKFVEAVVKFKEKTEDAIIAQDRKDHVINQRSEWAEELGLDKKAYANLFKQLIEHNISKELEILDNTK